MDRQKPVSGEFYRHFKGNLYQIKMLAKDCNTNKEVVVYQGMYAPYSCWVRELTEFMSLVDSSKYPDVVQKYRFEKLEEKELEQTVSKNLCNKVSQQSRMGESTLSDVKDIPDSSDNFNSSVKDDELVKALKTGQPDRYLADRLTESEIAQRGFMQLLDAETFHEKRQIFIGLKQYLDKRMLSNIAVALDIVLEEGSEQMQYESILKCLEAFEHYEGGRLR